MFCLFYLILSYFCFLGNPVLFVEVNVFGFLVTEQQCTFMLLCVYKQCVHVYSTSDKRNNPQLDKKKIVPFPGFPQFFSPEGEAAET